MPKNQLERLTVWALRFLIWEQDKHSQLGGDPPQHSIVEGECRYAVHCDYFKRRVEAPDKKKDNNG